MWAPAGLLGQLSRSRQAQGDSARMSQVPPDSQGSRNAGGAGPGAGGESRPPRCPWLWVLVHMNQVPQDVRAESGDPTEGGPSLVTRSFTGSRPGTWQGIPREAERAAQNGGHGRNRDRELPMRRCHPRPRVSQQVGTVLWGQEAGRPPGAQG